MSLIGFGSVEGARPCSYGCGGRPLAGTSPDGLGISPDGLGSDGSPPLARTVTGYPIADAALGAAIGYAMSPKESQNAIYAGAGAATLGLVGLPGLIGLAIFGIYVKSQAK